MRYPTDSGLTRDGRGCVLPVASAPGNLAEKRVAARYHERTGASRAAAADSFPFVTDPGS